MPWSLIYSTTVLGDIINCKNFYMTKVSELKGIHTKFIFQSAWNTDLLRSKLYVAFNFLYECAFDNWPVYILVCFQQELRRILTNVLQDLVASNYSAGMYLNNTCSYNMVCVILYTKSLFPFDVICAEKNFFLVTVWYPTSSKGRYFIVCQAVTKMCFVKQHDATINTATETLEWPQLSTLTKLLTLPKKLKTTNGHVHKCWDSSIIWFGCKLFSKLSFIVSSVNSSVALVFSNSLHHVVGLTLTNSNSLFFSHYVV